MTAGPRCLYYALGGGLGHGVRTLALARQLARRLGGRHWLLLNTPFAATLLPAIAREPGLTALTLSPQATPREAASFVGDTLAAIQPDLLITDTFPRGLGGELAHLLPDWSGAFRVLISRGLPRAYLETYDLTGFVREHYQLIIAPGERSPFEGRVEVQRTGAFLVRDFEELLSPAEAAHVLATDSERPVVLLVGSGTLSECQETEQLALELQTDWPDTGPPLRLALPAEVWAGPAVGSAVRVSHFPLLECMPAVRLVIGGAGYNLVHEVRALGLPAFFRPRRRKYDDQAGRVGAESRFTDLSVLRAAVFRELQQPRRLLTPCMNGATEAGLIIGKKAG
jgi:hypothetical protein